MRKGKGNAIAEHTVVERSEHLSTALDVGGPELEQESAGAAREVLGRVGERWAIAGGRTVVALAGATGSGKSSLFNALTGEDVSAISPRRPTTAEAGAAVWGDEDAAELLDWLGVANRHHVTMTEDNAGLDGLVLVDLPDVDSRELRHRVEADRILERADVFVWVADPQKYADARLHDDYLRPLRHHDAVMLVVLNQVDRIREEGGVEQIAADLRRLVQADGAGEHDIIATSARTQQGIPELRDRIGEVVGARNAAEARLVADLRSSADRVRERGTADQTPELGQEADQRLHQALTVASGVPVVLDAVDRDYRRRAAARTGWPFTRWVAGLRPDPLRRLRLGDDSPGEAGIAPSDVRAVLGRSSLPSPTPAARANVQLATRRLGEDVGGQLPQRWADAVLEAASPPEDTLADALDQAIVGVPLRTRPPFWWSVLGMLQLLFATTAVAGLLWLVLLVVLGWLQLPMDAPFWGPVPIPLALLVGGVLAGLLLALIGRLAAGVGAARRRRHVQQVLDDAIDEVSYRHVRKPVMTVLDRHEKTRTLLDQAAA
ncbi:ABC transporter [Serinicoccus sp. CNJ-927]|uniref:YfjP family GTPase n=1 Tax=unclassified Serinicoccus TaxID=2643101 RepID=UPI00095B4DB5|nr:MULTISPECIES: YfjP family GTPase [unclassified Serinicoccus]OLT15359.1 ABC transporter [Serinicoccus sp. CUA-874]OLT43534.1 ABC transporter [Serinicoccus sp. CNJ-927]